MMIFQRMSSMCRHILFVLTLLFFFIGAVHAAGLCAGNASANDRVGEGHAADWHARFVNEILPLLRQRCSDCHWSDGEAEGGVELDRLADADEALKQYRLVDSVLRVLQSQEMPPEEPLPIDEIRRVVNWYDDFFRPSLTPLPGALVARRLSRHELRYSLASVFGFDLEVAIIEAEQTVVEKSLVLKLLPDDPPGKSGFTNDTHGHPIRESEWEQIARLVDSGIETLLGPNRHSRLAGLLELELSVTEEDSMERFRSINGDDAEAILRVVFQRAYRRPAPDSILLRAIERLKVVQAEGLEERLRIEIKSAILSPAFLYRGLLAEQPAAEVKVAELDGVLSHNQAVGKCDDYELAERLSYFLWSESPDDELLSVASKDELHEQVRYREQVERLLDDPRSMRLSEHFAVEWLALSEIENVSNNPPVAHALYRQPIDYFDHLLRKNRPITELYDSDYTFANPHTARFYPSDRGKMAVYRKQRGIEVEAVKNQKLDLERTSERGGILTMPGVLAMNRGPVTRGTWMLERILGVHLPEPPANVGQVPPSPPGEHLSFRERFELHRSQSSCKACHKYIDPLGFALERYARDGTYLSEESAAEAKIDTSGILPTGERFSDFAGLQKLLLREKSEGVLRHLVERFLSYALCRELEWYDVKTVDRIVSSLSEQVDGSRYLRHDATFRDLIRLVTESLPFTHARS